MEHYFLRSRDIPSQDRDKEQTDRQTTDPTGQQDLALVPPVPTVIPTLPEFDPSLLESSSRLTSPELTEQETAHLTSSPTKGKDLDLTTSAYTMGPQGEDPDSLLPAASTVDSTSDLATGLTGLVPWLNLKIGGNKEISLPELSAVEEGPTMACSEVRTQIGSQTPQIDSSILLQARGKQTPTTGITIVHHHGHLQNFLQGGGSLWPVKPKCRRHRGRTKGMESRCHRH